MTFLININYNNHRAEEGLAVSLLAWGGRCAVKGGGVDSQSCVSKGCMGVMGLFLPGPRAQQGHKVHMRLYAC